MSESPPSLLTTHYHYLRRAVEPYRSKTGYLASQIQAQQPKPFQTRVRRSGKGYFATAEEAALCVARSSEEQAMAERVASAAPPLTGGRGGAAAGAGRDLPDGCVGHHLRGGGGGDGRT